MIRLLRPKTLVEPIGVDDSDEVAAIHSDAFNRAWSADEVTRMMAEDNIMALGARRQGPSRSRRLAGFVLLRTAADEAEVLTIAVRSGHRRRGCGRELMEEALRRLYRDRVSTCFLEVENTNRSALALYRSLGFEAAGERQGYYADGGSALVMRLTL